MAVLHIPLLIGAVMLVPFLVLWDDLPDPMAIHWDLAGRPDGAASIPVALAIPMLLWLFVAGRVLNVARRDGKGEGGSSSNPPPLQVAYFVGGSLLFLALTTLWANAGRAPWTAARHLPLLAAAGGFVGNGAAFALLGRVFERKLWIAAEVPASARPTLAHPPGRAETWAGHATNWIVPAIMLAIGIFLFGSMAGDVPDFMRVGMAVLFAFLGLTFASVSMIVTNEGVTIELGTLRWPRRKILLGEIEYAEVTQVEPIDYGGWGYRVCGKGCRAYVVKAGPGIAIKRKDGGSFTVTIERPEHGVALINSLVGGVPAP